MGTTPYHKDAKIKILDNHWMNVLRAAGSIQPGNLCLRLGLYNGMPSSISLWLGYDSTLWALSPSCFWFPSNRMCWNILRSNLKYHWLLGEFQGPSATQRNLKQLHPEIWCMDSGTTRPRSFVTLDLLVWPCCDLHSFLSSGRASWPEVSSWASVHHRKSSCEV